MAVSVNGHALSRAYGISADGLVVVGESFDGNGSEAFRWTTEAGMVGLGHLDDNDYNSSAYDVSADGSVVVGQGVTSDATSAFRWTAAEGMIGLGPLPGRENSTGQGTSADGSVVVGYSVSGGTVDHEAFRWTSATGMVGLGDLPGGTGELQAYSIAYGVSDNGAVVVGESESGLGREAFRWTTQDGMVGLGDLPGALVQSRANAASADGTTVVGSGSTEMGIEAFRWTNEAGMVGLGMLSESGGYSDAFDVSADGAVIVGISRADSGIDEAVIWGDGGLQRLLEVLVSNGATGLTGWTLLQASAVSANGRWIAGWGYNPDGQEEAFLADVAPIPLAAGAWLIAPAFGLLAPWVKRRRHSAEPVVLRQGISG